MQSYNFYLKSPRFLENIFMRRWYLLHLARKGGDIRDGVQWGDGYSAQALMKLALGNGDFCPKLWVLLPLTTNTSAPGNEEECPTYSGKSTQLIWASLPKAVGKLWAKTN